MCGRMLVTMLALLLVLVSPALAVPRPVKVAAIFDHDSDMRHDLMFVNAIKVGGA